MREFDAERLDVVDDGKQTRHLDRIGPARRSSTSVKARNRRGPEEAKQPATAYA